MISLISPAKKMRENIDAQIYGENLLTSQPYFSQENAHLADIMQQKSAQDLQSMMGISDKLAALNYQRYQDIKYQDIQYQDIQYQDIKYQDIKNGTAKKLPAMYAFAGDVYQSLCPDDFSDDDVAFANQHLAILSGFYGLLRPCDAIMPYRLEMGIGLKINDATSPYLFWRDKITDYLHALLQSHPQKIVLNLASKEYSQAINAKKLPSFINISFRQRRGNQLKNIGLMAKRARGAMARHIILGKIDTPQQVQKIRFDNYQFDSTLSSDTDYMFIQST